MRRLRRLDIIKCASACASIMMLLSLQISSAGTETASKQPVAPPVTPPLEESWIHGDFGLNVVNEYISRGVVVENEGAILQPYLDLYVTGYESHTGFINKVTLNLGLWDSFHSRKTQADSDNLKYWFESDFNLGVSITFLKHWTLSPSFFAFTSPSDAFKTATGLNIKLAFDDSDYLKIVAFHPYAFGSGKATSQGPYYEIGIRPSYTVGPVTFTLPVICGFGSNNFYAKNAVFGYGSVGLNASYALPLPKKLGTWSLNSGIAYYYLGNGLYDFNSPAIRESDQATCFTQVVSA